MKHMRIIYMVLLAPLLALGCTRGGGDGYGAPSGAGEANILRLEPLVFDGRSDSSAKAGLEALGHILGFDADSGLHEYSESPAVRIFTPDVLAEYPDLAGLPRSLGGVESGIEGLFPDVHAHEFYTAISPYSQSIYIYADTMVFIALNHYLGVDYPGYAGRFNEYERQMKTRERIPYDVAEAIIATLKPFEGDSTGVTVASRLLYEGALLASVRTVVPGADDSLVLGFTPQQWQWALDHEAEMWKALLGRGMLYSVSPTDAARLFSPSPSTGVLHRDAPGRMGRFLGLRIVDSYLDNNPGTTLSQMLSPSFYNDSRTIFKSGYGRR